MNLIKNFAKEYRLHILCLSANFEHPTYNCNILNTDTAPNILRYTLRYRTIPIYLNKWPFVLSYTVFGRQQFSYALIAVSKATNEAPPDEFNAIHVLQPRNVKISFEM